jgi:hypothetical protein
MTYAISCPFNTESLVTLSRSYSYLTLAFSTRQQRRAVVKYSRCVTSRHGARNMRPSPSPSAVMDPYSHSCVNYELPTRVARDRFLVLSGKSTSMRNVPSTHGGRPGLRGAQIDRVEVDVARHPRSGEVVGWISQQFLPTPQTV